MFYVQLVLTGLATGCIYSLSAMGLVLTYKATGIFNFAHGGVAVVVAYLFWQMQSVWGLPIWISAPVALLVIGPAIGLLLERFIFRSLQEAQASTSEKLVATLGLLTLSLGVVYAVWGGGVREAARLFPDRPITLFADLQTSTDQIGRFILVVVISALLFYLFKYTFLGTQIRAVVDRRELSELASVNADRVAGLSWAMGCGLAGLTGVLLAPPALEPFRLTLLVIETFSIAVVARLVSLPMAVASGILLLGVGSSLLTQVHVFNSRGLIGEGLEQLKPNLSVVILFVVLVAYRKFDELGAGGPSRLVAASTGKSTGRLASTVVKVVVLAIAVFLPFFLNDIDIRYAHRMLGLVVIFTSIVCVTGFSGYITLGQAAFAGIGAFFTARAVNGLQLPVIPGMLVGGLVALVFGIIAGYPALKRRGLFLGLTTLSLGLLVYQFIFNSEQFKGGAGGLVIDRPSLFGLKLDGPIAFYFFELVVVGLMLLLARNLRSGRLGRILGALRDSETATRSVGIDLRTYKLFIFAMSAFIAGIGGSLLAQAELAFEPRSFDPLTSLFWFTAVIVAGVSYISGAILAAAIWVLLPLLLGIDLNAAQAFIGIGAVLLGRLPGGLFGLLRRAGTWSLQPRALMRFFESNRQALHEPPEAATPPPVPSDFAERVLADAEVARAERAAV